MRTRLVLPFVALVLVACGGGGGARVESDPTSTGNWQQRLSAGFLGCRPGRIEIRDWYEGVTDTWVASCGERTIICGWARGSGAPVCTDLVE